MKIAFISHWNGFCFIPLGKSASWMSTSTTCEMQKVHFFENFVVNSLYMNLGVMYRPYRPLISTISQRMSSAAENRSKFSTLLSIIYEIRVFTVIFGSGWKCINMGTTPWILRKISFKVHIFVQICSQLVKFWCVRGNQWPEGPLCKWATFRFLKELKKDALLGGTNISGECQFHCAKV